MLSDVFTPSRQAERLHYPGPALPFASHGLTQSTQTRCGQVLIPTATVFFVESTLRTVPCSVFSTAPFPAQHENWASDPSNGSSPFLPPRRPQNSLSAAKRPKEVFFLSPDLAKYLGDSGCITRAVSDTRRPQTHTHPATHQGKKPPEHSTSRSGVSRTGV